MTTPVNTTEQLEERIRLIADTLSIELVAVTSRVAANGKLYASVSTYDSAQAVMLTSALRRESSEFGELGKELTARREYRHVHVFLPMPPADADRGEAFLARFQTPRTEF